MCMVGDINRHSYLVPIVLALVRMSKRPKCRVCDTNGVSRKGKACRDCANARNLEIGSAERKAFVDPQNTEQRYIHDEHLFCVEDYDFEKSVYCSVLKYEP